MVLAGIGPGTGGRLTFVQDGEKAAKQPSATSTVASQADKTDRKDSSVLGNALRAVYQDAIGESVPDEMLDLLSKLK
ncbi:MULTISPECIES: NepR family anti-sigma factor [unclassified Sphingomonas]|uniref:NepR family anti-sigma factor n=1 Tax=unclassified Sphingomonas TaxID=196159 RepID=UPI000AF2E237|nr:MULTISPECIES: NepR family anti-sigma factor [unclassified Sphingomonas]